MPRTVSHGFDAAVVDREDHTVALIEVKTHPVHGWATILRNQLALIPEPIPFLLAIDPDEIRVYRTEGGILGEPMIRLETRQVLRHYDPKFPGERVYAAYLLTLVEAWLRDLAYHWKSEDPPGSAELGRAGLLEKFEGGTTRPLDA